MFSQRDPIDHPSAWVGRQLFDAPEWNLTITDEEIDELLAVARQIAEKEEFDGDEMQEPILLPVLQPKLNWIRERLEHGSGAVRLLGFPTDQLPSDRGSRAAFWALCNALGTPVSQSAAGDRIFSVRDEGFTSTDPRARGPNTRKSLSFHTDRCDVIAFWCLQPAKSGGDNDVVSSVSLYNRMLQTRPDLVDVLMQPFLYQRHNVDVGNERAYCEQPIFSIFEGYFAANLLRVLIDRAYAAADTPEMTPLQREALDHLQDLAQEPEMHASFRQGAGDMLFLNNFVTLHRRGEFVDFEQPQQKRHLLRVWLAMPNSRPLDPHFQANYGSTEAGAIRGGMHSQ